MRHMNPRRRGIALIDVLIGGVILGIGMAVVMTSASRALAAQRDGEKQITAAWLADELLSMVLVEGPDVYPRLYDNAGAFDAPFEQYRYEVEIIDNGLGQPFTVIANVSWPGVGAQKSVVVQTEIALRRGDLSDTTREPIEPLDRDARYFDEEETDG